MKLTRKHIENIVKEYLEGEEELPSDVSRFAEKLESSGLDDYIKKINESDELYGLIAVILKTALESDSPIDENKIIEVLKDVTEDFGKNDE